MRKERTRAIGLGRRHFLDGQFVEVADLVSEIQPIKHPFDQGIKAQRGIEF